MSILPKDFNYDFYRTFHRDLTKFNNDQLKNHYLKYGKKEGRIYKLPDNFIPSVYRDLNKDLRHLDDENIIKHFIKNGIKENRIYKIENNISEKENNITEKENNIIEKENNISEKENNISEKENNICEKENNICEKEIKIYKLPNDFIPSVYRDLNKDLRHLDDENIIKHFIKNGIKENRIYKNDFSFKNKPSNWNTLPLFHKVRFIKNKISRSYAPYIDKLEVKNLVKKMYGNKIEVPKTIRILKNIYDISENDLNSNYMIKGAHGTGFNINIKPNIKYNINDIISLLQKFNVLYNPKHEIQYSYLKPTFYIEEKIVDKYYGKNGEAICYMIRCIHGIPYTFSPYIKKTNEQYNYLFDKNKKLIDIKMDYQKFNQKLLNINIKIIGQENIEKMYDIASLMSKPFEFVRIDLYLDVNNKIYLNEYTFTPAQGNQNYPMEIEMKLGKLWK